MNIVVLSWVRAEKYCDDSGETMNAVLERIRNAEWAAGKHFKRTSQRVLWINRQAVEEWINQQPHVEAVCHLASKSAKARAETAFA